MASTAAAADRQGKEASPLEPTLERQSADRPVDRPAGPADLQRHGPRTHARGARFQRHPQHTVSLSPTTTTTGSSSTSTTTSSAHISTITTSPALVADLPGSHFAGQQDPTSLATSGKHLASISIHNRSPSRPAGFGRYPKRPSALATHLHMPISRQDVPLHSPESSDHDSDLMQQTPPSMSLPPPIRHLPRTATLPVPARSTSASPSKSHSLLVPVVASPSHSIGYGGLRSSFYQSQSHQISVETSLSIHPHHPQARPSIFSWNSGSGSTSAKSGDDDEDFVYTRSTGRRTLRALKGAMEYRPLSSLSGSSGSSYPSLQSSPGGSAGLLHPNHAAPVSPSQSFGRNLPFGYGSFVRPKRPGPARNIGFKDSPDSRRTGYSKLTGQRSPGLEHEGFNLPGGDESLQSPMALDSRPLLAQTHEYVRTFYRSLLSRPTHAAPFEHPPPAVLVPVPGESSPLLPRSRMDVSGMDRSQALLLNERLDPASRDPLRVSVARGILIQSPRPNPSRSWFLSSMLFLLMVVSIAAFGGLLSYILLFGKPLIGLGCIGINGKTLVATKHVFAFDVELEAHNFNMSPVEVVFGEIDISVARPDDFGGNGYSNGTNSEAPGRTIVGHVSRLKEPAFFDSNQRSVEVIRIEVPSPRPGSHEIYEAFPYVLRLQGFLIYNVTGGWITYRNRLDHAFFIEKRHHRELQSQRLG